MDLAQKVFRAAEYLKFGTEIEDKDWLLNVKAVQTAFLYLELLKITPFGEREAFEKKHTEDITKFNTTLKRPKIQREQDKPYGKCIFYEENIGCKIHKAKPYECRIAMGCKPYGEELITWFDLKYFFYFCSQIL